MNHLAAASRLGRAVCELALRPGSGLAYAVASTPDETARASVIRVATALGHSVIRASLKPREDEVHASDLAGALTNSSGSTLAILDATAFDGCAAHRDDVRTTARAADLAKAHGGEIALLVMTGDDPCDPAPIAQLIGEELKDHGWAAAIAL